MNFSYNGCRLSSSLLKTRPVLSLKNSTKVRSCNRKVRFGQDKGSSVDIFGFLTTESIMNSVSVRSCHRKVPIQDKGSSLDIFGFLTTKSMQDYSFIIPKAGGFVFIL